VECAPLLWTAATILALKDAEELGFAVLIIIARTLYLARSPIEINGRLWHAKTRFTKSVSSIVTIVH
jgi:hypothetical protein